MTRPRDKDLLRASTKILTMLLEVDEKEGISIKHLRLIQLMTEHIYREEPCTPAKLAEATGWPRSTISRLLGDLAGYNHARHPAFLKFEMDETNRRLKVIVPTEAAQECKKRVLRGLRDALEGL